MQRRQVRLHSCAISSGIFGGYNLWTLKPSRFAIQQRAWDIRDYVLFAAREYGLRVVLPLTDNYRYYHGGKYDFINFISGTSQADGGSQFYTNRAVIQTYTQYITVLLNRVNTYTGVRWADDPTILAWETGNELGGYIESEMWPPTSWTNAIVGAIRQYDTNHLIIDGASQGSRFILRRREADPLLFPIVCTGTNGFWNCTYQILPADTKSCSTADTT